MITVYISIGNSDDKLTQFEWMCFQIDMRRVFDEFGIFTFHGDWHSHPMHRFQNACWCVEVLPGAVEPLKAKLRRVAVNYRQDSIAWAEVTRTEFIGADGD